MTSASCARPRTSPGSWLTYGQTYKEQRFSTLDQITRENVGDLKLAWSKPIGGRSERMQGTPLVVDGVMYATNGWGVIYALDPATGEEIWTHDPQTDRTYVKYSCCGGVANRGVAVYRGKVYVALFDGRLVAVDAATGEEVWDVDTYHPSALGRFNITGAPRAAAGKVFIGQGSSESGKRRGYVSAYDAETGELAWRFYLVPGDPSKPFEHPEMEMAAKTWGGEWWKMGGGGTAWNSLVYDEEAEPALHRRRQRRALVAPGPFARRRRRPVPDRDRGRRRRYRRDEVVLPDGSRRQLGLQLGDGHRAQ